MDKGWHISEETASYKVNETQVLHITRVLGGINIKVVEDLPNNKTRTLYIKFIGDAQLGLCVPNER